MPGLVAVGHSHRPTTKVSHKAFKSRKATKGAVRDASKGQFGRARPIYLDIGFHKLAFMLTRPNQVG